MHFKNLKKPQSYLEKTYFQIKLNYEGVKILSTGGTPEEIFAANAHRSYFMSFAYIYLHHTLDKNSHVEALYDYSFGKIKSRKSPWVKKTKKTGPKKNKRDKEMCCNVMLFPGNRYLLSETLRGPVFPLVCNFIRRYNLYAWRGLFTNLYKLKFRI